MFEQIVVALQIPGLNKYSVGYCLRDHFWRVTNAYIKAALGYVPVVAITGLHFGEHVCGEGQRKGQSS